MLCSHHFNPGLDAEFSPARLHLIKIVVPASD
jgi:hypothetical protein